MRVLSSLALALVLALGVAACAKSSSAPKESAGAESAKTYPPPPASSPLSKVQTGMSEREVEKLLGPPTSQNAYVTGKAFIPWYYGPDRSRVGYFYKGQGRVVFAASSGMGRELRVQRVEYDPSEPGRPR